MILNAALSATPPRLVLPPATLRKPFANALEPRVGPCVSGSIPCPREASGSKRHRQGPCALRRRERPPRSSLRFLDYSSSRSALSAGEPAHRLTKGTTPGPGSSSGGGGCSSRIGPAHPATAEGPADDIAVRTCPDPGDLRIVQQRPSLELSVVAHHEAQWPREWSTGGRPNAIWPISPCTRGGLAQASSLARGPVTPPQGARHSRRLLLRHLSSGQLTYSAFPGIAAVQAGRPTTRFLM